MTNKVWSTVIHLMKVELQKMKYKKKDDWMTGSASPDAHFLVFFWSF